MRILMINTHHYLRGGDCRYTFDLSRLLEEHGHDVIHFAMLHPENLTSKYERFFVPYIDYAKLNTSRSFHSYFRVLTTAFWNHSAQIKLKALLNEISPDIAHIQNILHHITPSILPVLKNKGIPIVHHLHDYNLICPDIYLLRNGKICEACFGQKYYWGLIHKCKKQSITASLVAVLQRYFHDILKPFRHVSKFISPSAFAREKFIEANFPYTDKIVHIPHFINIREIVFNNNFEQTDGVIFAGRLIQEKGLWTLLKAAEIVSEVPITIFGEGELRSEMQHLVNSKKLLNVKFKGWQPQKVLMENIQKARAVVMPSEWYETAGLSVLEAGAVGRASIVSSNTAMTENIRHEESGLIFPMGDAEKLAQSIKRLASDFQLAKSLGRNARTRVERIYNPKTHYSKIVRLYQRVIEEQVRS